MYNDFILLENIVISLLLSCYSLHQILKNAMLGGVALYQHLWWLYWWL